MDTLLPLRGFAIASNIMFIVYGIAGQLYPVLLLHAVLLPINIGKIVQLVQKNRFERSRA
jgi:CRP/FNR family transcriptional regulator, cyclic AMP receptor protein